MEFNKFKKALQKQFDDMIKNQNKLFLTDVFRDDLWENYLESFPDGTNQIYKERREYDCNSCKSFIRSCGNIVTVKDNKLVSIWDIAEIDYPYDVVSKSMSVLVKSAPIKNVFVTKFPELGIDNNKKLLENGKVVTWEHFYYKLPGSYMNFSDDSIESVQGSFRESKNVFMRSMAELTIEAGRIILELIEQNSLYRGEEFKGIINKFIAYKEEYNNIPEEDKNNWSWANSFNNPVSRIRNSAIGTLLIDLSADMDIDQAVRKFEAVMAPANYKRPNAIYTKKMVEDAQIKIEELGFSDSLNRKFAELEDITINNILFADRDARKELKNSVFDELKEDIPESIKNFEKVEEIDIEDFIKNILPLSTGIELMMENKHTSNLMSLVAPTEKNASTMFKWNNNFSWAYNGDIADSMKQNVKNAGGNIEGILRFSIQWNDGDNNQNDFDAHCIEPNGNLISYPKKGQMQPSTGMLDVDIVNPGENVAVENITWVDEKKMLEGTYKFIVHNYRHNGGRTGFSAEIEYDSQIYSFEYSKELKQNEKILVAEISFERGSGIKFIKSLDSTKSSKEIWKVKTNIFSKISVCMFSPNYWDNQDSIGNKHYFFFIDGCRNETTPRGFFNEFLKEDLLVHKKVFEALGSKMRVSASDNQLSGLGFSSTQRNSILAKIEGSFKRVIKINF